MLERFELLPADGAAERTRRRSITIIPARGGRVVLRDLAVAEPAAPGRTHGAVALA